METEAEIIELVKKLDITSYLEQEKHWNELKKLNVDIPYFFLKVYPEFKKWQGRVHLLFHCTKYARISESAFQLGIKALNDKATLVRYRAAGVLAYSLRKDAIPYLKQNLRHHDRETQDDSRRAIRAIRNRNHHIFMGQRGKWIVNKGIDDNQNSVNNVIKRAIQMINWLIYN